MAPLSFCPPVSFRVSASFHALCGKTFLALVLMALDGVFPAGNWDLIGQQLYLINSVGKQHPLERYDLTTGQMSSLSQNLDRVLFDTASLSVDPLSPSILFARQAVTDGSSIEALVGR